MCLFMIYCVRCPYGCLEKSNEIRFIISIIAIFVLFFTFIFFKFSDTITKKAKVINLSFIFER